MSRNREDMDDPRFRITPVQQMAASCSGALITSLFMTPLDVVKIRLQVQQKALLSNRCFIYCNGLMDHLCYCNGQPAFAAGRSTHYNGTLDAMLKISRSEGIASLWSGLGPTLVLALPVTVIYFVSYEQLRFKIKDKYNSLYSTTSKHAIQPLWIPLLAGCIARLTAATIVSPLELIRTKMQSQKLSYLELGIVLRTLIQNQGVSGLWRGLGPTLLRDVPFSGLYWLFYETIKSKFGPTTGNPSFLFSFVSGGIAGSIAATITIPFDVVKTHQQIEIGEEICSDAPKKTGGVAATIKNIYRSHGIRGLYTGLTPRLVKVAPACAIMIGSFEYGKAFFTSYNKTVYEHKEPIINIQQL